MKKLFSLSFILLTAIIAAAQTKRPLNPSDFFRYVDVTDPQVSPDGKWCAYVVTTVDTSKDGTNSDVWMVSWDGKDNVQLTNSMEDESEPRFSPDNKYISFLSSRSFDDDKDDEKDNDESQLWLMNRLGGEAKKITDVKNDIDDYAWSPDGKKILL